MATTSGMSFALPDSIPSHVVARRPNDLRASNQIGLTIAGYDNAGCALPSPYVMPGSVPDAPRGQNVNANPNLLHVTGMSAESHVLNEPLRTDVLT